MMSIKHNCVFNLLDCAVIRIKKMRGMDSDNDWNRKWNLSMKIIQTLNAIEDARQTPHIINLNPTMAIF